MYFNITPLHCTGQIDFFLINKNFIEKEEKQYKCTGSEPDWKRKQKLKTN